ncbi:MAG: bifunctional enoyl-CoA hydratase/phosphate acetyltransferase [Dokdonella sp.]
MRLTSWNTTLQYLQNKTFDEIRIGDSAEIVRVLTQADSELFGAALFTAVIGTELPGSGTVCLDQSLRFHKPLIAGDALTVRVSVRTKDAATKQVTLDCTCCDAQGTTVIAGETTVLAPTIKVRRPRALVLIPELHERGARYRRLIEATAGLEPIRTAVVHPCDAVSIAAAMDAQAKGLISPILVGPETRIRNAAAQAGCDLGDVEIVNTPHSHAAAAQAVALARSGQVQALMKGALHTDELMGAIIPADAGLRTERRMSHVFAFDVPYYPKPLFITDAAINIYPDLTAKRDIVQNAIELAHALNIATPKVAILSAVETVTPKITSTVEAAALCKMADRGQIAGGILDGPLAFDNAISRDAAAAKHIVSPVAGDADILVVPDIESGNMLAKQLVYLAGADSAGIVLGARVPIMLNSRSDPELSRLASCALALLFVHRHQQGPT